MWESIQLTYRQYMAFYGAFFADQWHNLTPIKYGCLLIAIGIAGWLLMKSGTKKYG